MMMMMMSIVRRELVRVLVYDIESSVVHRPSHGRQFKKKLPLGELPFPSASPSSPVCFSHLIPCFSFLLLSALVVLNLISSQRVEECCKLSHRMREEHGHWPPNVSDGFWAEKGILHDSYAEEDCARDNVVWVKQCMGWIV